MDSLIYGSLCVRRTKPLKVVRQLVSGSEAEGRGGTDAVKRLIQMDD